MTNMFIFLLFMLSGVESSIPVAERQMAQAEDKVEFLQKKMNLIKSVKQRTPSHFAQMHRVTLELAESKKQLGRRQLVLNQLKNVGGELPDGGPPVFPNRYGATENQEPNGPNHHDWDETPADRDQTHVSKVEEAADATGVLTMYPEAHQCDTETQGKQYIVRQTDGSSWKEFTSGSLLDCGKCYLLTEMGKSCNVSATATTCFYASVYPSPISDIYPQGAIRFGMWRTKGECEAHHTKDDPETPEKGNPEEPTKRFHDTPDEAHHVDFLFPTDSNHHVYDPARPEIPMTMHTLKLGTDMKGHGMTSCFPLPVIDRFYHARLNFGFPACVQSAEFDNWHSDIDRIEEENEHNGYNDRKKDWLAGGAEKKRHQEEEDEEEHMKKESEEEQHWGYVDTDKGEITRPKYDHSADGGPKPDGDPEAEIKSFAMQKDGGLGMAILVGMLASYAWM